MEALPRPEDPELRAAADQTGLLGPGMAGLTLGHSIFICKGHESVRLLSHEFRHVSQYEKAGSIADFLPGYLLQIVPFGYQSQFTEFSRHLREWTIIAQRLDNFAAVMERQANAIERLVAQLANRASLLEEPSAEARQLSPEQAQQEILELFRRRKRLFYSDIAEELRLDLATVMSACAELERRGLIDSETDHTEACSHAPSSRAVAASPLTDATS